MAGRDVVDYETRDPFKESGQMQTSDDQHHRKQEHEGRIVNAPNSLLRGDEAKGKHQSCADDRHRRPVDTHPGKTADGKDEVTGEKMM
jgi:hypothetical protein